MRDYRVIWAIDISADSAEAAARAALTIQRDPQSIATVLTVIDSETGDQAEIDLLDIGPVLQL